MTFIDLSHTIHDGLETYPGLPAPKICDFWNREDSAAHYAAGTSFQIGRIDMVANTGTYLDAPFHRYEDGPDVAALELEQLADLPGVLVDAPAGARAIGPCVFEGLDLAGRAVLVRTGWSRHWGTAAYFEGHPYLTAEAAEYLRARGPALVGIDSLNIDDTSGGERPVHTMLLGAGILIVEHLCNLDTLMKSASAKGAAETYNAVATGGFAFTAAPVKVAGMGSFPVRAFATLGQRIDKRAKIKG